MPAGAVRLDDGDLGRLSPALFFGSMALFDVPILVENICRHHGIFMII